MRSTPITEIVEGFTTACEYVLSDAVFQGFLDTFGDTNPLHTADAFAREHGFPGRVMHGMILNGFLSHFVGTQFPGVGWLLHAANTQFKSPSHLGDAIRLEATVTHVSAAVGVLHLDVVVTNVTRGRVAARARVQMGTL